MNSCFSQIFNDVSVYNPNGSARNALDGSKDINVNAINSYR